VQRQETGTLIRAFLMTKPKPYKPTDPYIKLYRAVTKFDWSIDGLTTWLQYENKEETENRTIKLWEDFKLKNHRPGRTKSDSGSLKSESAI
jgi:hypothetical protein